MTAKSDFTELSKIELSGEQKLFVEKALEGHNLLVNACIGSGKTTAIQQLCNILPTTKQICYLTYNKLLKIDAKAKIKNSNVMVTNYHGFAYTALIQIGYRTGVSDLIQTFNRIKPPTHRFDILIVDEYQDIDQELSEMLEIIKSRNPKIQIIFVGDMHQKIYDKTTLDVAKFAHEFLDEYIELEFTKCFRLSEPIATALGRVWTKTIHGVNENCKVEKMNMEQVKSFVSAQKPEDILCLGSRTGDMNELLNYLESYFPERFNKKTVYASISDQDRGSVVPTKTSAIFTTYDSSKGLERPICIIFDFSESYWHSRIHKPQQSYQILKNIFCVAASRGKEHIIFVDNNEMLREKTLTTNPDQKQEIGKLDISAMFDFKYKEDVEKCFSLLEVEPIIQSDKKIIKISQHDYLIDLAPCIGIYQEASYFDNYNIDDAINFHFDIHSKGKKSASAQIDSLSIEEKILFLTALETSQHRYTDQVKIPFISTEEKQEIQNRLATQFSTDEEVQTHCTIFFKDKNGNLLFPAMGLADVVKNNTVIELKFIDDVSHENFLQTACYMIALKLKKGILWNVRNNDMYSIKIPDKQKFMDAVIQTVSKGIYKQFYF